MRHSSEEELVNGYYDGLAPEQKLHLGVCPDCADWYRSISETLDSVKHAEIPERSPGYGAEVWARVLPALPLEKAKPVWFRWWVFAPVAAALLTMVFVAGMLTQQKRHVPALDNRSERVLYLAMSEHMDEAQIVLSELAHTRAGNAGLSEERGRARDLITQNRILRQQALHSGDVTDAAVLDDLERVFMEVANSDSSLEAVRERVENGNLLFRVRISSSDARLKGERL